MREAFYDKLIMAATFVVYLILFEIWLRVAPDPGWGDIELIFLFIPVLTTVVLYGLGWALLLGGILFLVYLPAIWPSISVGRASLLEPLMKLALLLALCFGAEIYKKYEDKKRRKLAKLARSLETKTNQQKALIRAQQALGSDLDLNHQLQEFLRWATELVSAKEGYITLYNRDKKSMVLASARKTISSDNLPSPLQGILSPQRRYNERRMEKFINEMNVAPNTICIPLKVDQELVGSLCLITDGKKRYFTQDELSLIQMLGAKAATAIENAKLHELNTQLFIDSVRTLAKILDARDSDTRDHSRRVAEKATELARKIGLSEEEVKRVNLAAELHDIGRVVIPDSILKKPAALTSKEFEMVKKHPVTGFNLLKSIRAFNDILPGILYHHEHYDGSGYPKGLKGRKIPLIARIIAVADTYDALTSSRPHRKRFSPEEARKIMYQEAGRKLDPQLVKTFFN